MVHGDFLGSTSSELFKTEQIQLALICGSFSSHLFFFFLSVLLSASALLPLPDQWHWGGRLRGSVVHCSACFSSVVLSF